MSREISTHKLLITDKWVGTASPQSSLPALLTAPSPQETLARVGLVGLGGSQGGGIEGALQGVVAASLGHWDREPSGGAPPLFWGFLGGCGPWLGASEHLGRELMCHRGLGHPAKSPATPGPLCDSSGFCGSSGQRDKIKPSPLLGSKGGSQDGPCCPQAQRGSG